MRNKSNSVFYNNENYYDSTAGLALMNIIKEERKKYYRPKKAVGVTYKAKEPITQKHLKATDVDNPEVLFCSIFTKFYNDTHGTRENGKRKKLGKYDTIYNWLELYNYCITNCCEDWFFIAHVVEHFNLDTDRRVKQVFSGQGDIGKLIQCYNSWLETDDFIWSMGGGAKVSYQTLCYK
ncbi:MAG: hypothetical protein J6M24_06270 [Lachnospiraceae bacterium]|nr:hypothetical protein [Lachnospiraceae bacterium]